MANTIREAQDKPISERSSLVERTPSQGRPGPLGDHHVDGQQRHVAADTAAQRRHLNGAAYLPASNSVQGLTIPLAQQLKASGKTYLIDQSLADWRSEFGHCPVSNRLSIVTRKRSVPPRGRSSKACHFLRCSGRKLPEQRRRWIKPDLVPMTSSVQPYSTIHERRMR